MNELQVGVELLVVGLIIVFLVLLLLMLVMQSLSKFSVRLTTQTNDPIVPIVLPEVKNSSEEELAAVLAVISKKLPENSKYSLKIRF